MKHDQTIWNYNMNAVITIVAIICICTACSRHETMAADHGNAEAIAPANHAPAKVSSENRGSGNALMTNNNTSLKDIQYEVSYKQSLKLGVGVYVDSPATGTPEGTESISNLVIGGLSVRLRSPDVSDRVIKTVDYGDIYFIETPRTNLASYEIDAYEWAGVTPVDRHYRGHAEQVDRLIKDIEHNATPVMADVPINPSEESNSAMDQTNFTSIAMAPPIHLPPQAPIYPDGATVTQRLEKLIEYLKARSTIVYHPLLANPSEDNDLAIARLDSNTVLVTISDRAVTAASVDLMVRSVADGRSATFYGRMRRQMADKYVNKVLLLLETERRCIDATESEIDEEVSKLKDQLPSGYMITDMLARVGCTMKQLRAELRDEIRIKRLLVNDVLSTNAQTVTVGTLTITSPAEWAPASGSEVEQIKAEIKQGIDQMMERYRDSTRMEHGAFGMRDFKALKLPDDSGWCILHLVSVPAQTDYYDTMASDTKQKLDWGLSQGVFERIVECGIVKVGDESVMKTIVRQKGGGRMITVIHWSSKEPSAVTQLMILESKTDQPVPKQVDDVVASLKVGVGDTTTSELVRDDRTLHARHILVQVFPDAPAAEKAKAREKIERIRADLLAGQDFVKLAEKHSDCSSKTDGGDLGQFARGVMVKPFEDAAFSQEPGEIGPVIETVFGFHIVQVLSP